jgi:hypothetical protein
VVAITVCHCNPHGHRPRYATMKGAARAGPMVAQSHGEMILGPPRDQRAYSTLLDGQIDCGPAGSVMPWS